ncbi:glycosyltransferase family 76 protein [Periconia macrospinosa]|uniref:GPI mannosyltransferase 2 n=1 Tax=Periconia macrospinosa TaxID=97972 RepID=A0A2V1E139_9PLEO|nr:glycosyltransferase family 76 protein [Periconia macrospinosa]
MKPTEAKQRPVGFASWKVLLGSIVLWKCLLLAVAALAPGPGYDTSALILANPELNRYEKFENSTILGNSALKLFRWDALYFVEAAKRNKVYEQEWAFSWAYSHILRRATERKSVLHIGLFSKDVEPPLGTYLWVSVFVSIVMHWASVASLFSLLNQVMSTPSGNPISFVACVLHIVSPAGIFLVAPYAESMFAALNIYGMLCYVRSRCGVIPSQDRTVKQDIMLLASGCMFACAAMIRGNGLLSGLIFVSDVASSALRILKGRTIRNELRLVAVTCVAGVLLALGFVFPQYVAFKEYCTTAGGVTRPPWCEKTIPSIYSWVQSKYWNVGFLRYWTIPNLPLFLLAAPVLWLLLQSSATYLRNSKNELLGFAHISHGNSLTKPTGTKRVSNNFPQLVLPQLALALAAATSFHVQIINRISSGYPLWYLSVAKSATASESSNQRSKVGFSFQIVVRGMIMYVIIQAALYASFLPPA